MPYQPFTFVFPTRIVFGPGESGRCAELAAELKPEKVFVCTYADVRLPVLDQLLTGLDQRGVPYYLHAACTANPRAEQIDEAAAIFLREGCDLVVGIGGGSVIDTCKGVALLAKNPCPEGVWAYVSGEKTAENGAYPIGLVVTIASTGSESNESFVVTDRLGEQKMICNHPSVRPTFSICDPTLTLTLPKRQTALGAADIFSHVLEQYLHRDAAVDVSDNMSLGILEAVYQWGPVACETPGDLNARSNLMWASILAMSRVLGVGHEENWLCHMLEHAVSAKYNIAHGAGMTAILPAYLRFIAPQDDAGKLDALKKLFGAEDAAAGLEAFFRRLGLPVNLTEALGFTPDDGIIRELAQNALPWGDMAAGGYAPFTLEDAITVLSEACK